MYMFIVYNQHTQCTIVYNIDQYKMSSQNSNKSSQKISQLLKINNPGRAVDILFSDLKVPQIHELYANIQQSKKANTIALKQTLQNNYQKMLYCVELLDKVRVYADNVKQLAAGIQNQISVDTVDSNNKQNNNAQSASYERIQSIEKLIRQGKFYQAMKQSFENTKEMNDQDRYYVFYLRIEIVNKMERHICQHRLDEKKLNEYAKCLQSYLYQNTGRNINKLRANLQQNLRDFSQKSLPYLLYKRLATLPQTSTSSSLLPLLYETLFQYKLLTLNNKIKINHSQQYFEQYFQQLGVILKFYNKLKINNNTEQESSLSKIFSQCATKIKRQLASIFIYKQSNGQIVFKMELYQELIRSQHFEQVIDHFYSEITENGKYKVEHPLQFIKDLWHDYFINLIDMSIDQASPLPRISTLKQHSLNYDNIPAELKLYLHDHSLQQSLHIINQYRNQKIPLLLRNVLPIVKKCSKEELAMCRDKFNSKLDQKLGKFVQFKHNIEEQMEQSLLNNNGSSLGFRKILLLRILGGKLDQQVASMNAQYRVGIEQNKFSNNLTIIRPQCYWKSFISKSQHKSIFQQLLDFDAFFVGYLQQFHNTEMKQVVLQAMCQISLPILIYAQQSSGKSKEALAHTIDSLKQKREKVTIFDRIAVPYLAKNIYDIAMKPVSLQKSVYQKNFVRKETIKVPEKVVEVPPAAQQFQIGEKQDKQELIAPNIGKSIKSLGNSLFTGFMKKKENRN